ILIERIASKPALELIDTSTFKDQKVFEFWARKHNLKSMALGLVELRNLGIYTKEDLEMQIESLADKKI
ncbi:endonuclease, partial [Streptococcus suis]